MYTRYKFLCITFLKHKFTVSKTRKYTHYAEHRVVALSEMYRVALASVKLIPFLEVALSPGKVQHNIVRQVVRWQLLL